jgi:hypothetical protein
MKKYLFLTFLILSIISCHNAKRDLQLNEISKGLTLTKINLKQECQIFKLKFKKCSMIIPKCRKYNDSGISLLEIANEFIEPKDSLYFYKSSSSSDIKKLFDSTIYKMKKTLEVVDSNYLSEIHKNISVPDFVEVDNDDDVRLVNILINQINILTLELKYMRDLYNYSAPDPDFKIATTTIHSDSGSVGDKFSTYLLNFIVEDSRDNPRFELADFKLDGKAYKINYSIERDNEFPTFNFTPDKSGHYVWTVNKYIQMADGTQKVYKYKDSIDIK